MIASRLRIRFLALGCFVMGPAFGQAGDGRRDLFLPVPQAAAESGLRPEDWAEIWAAFEQGRQAANRPDDAGAQPGFGVTQQAMAGGPILQQEIYLKPSNTSYGDGFGAFGYSVSVSGDTVLVGSPGEDSDATGVNGDQHNQLASQSGAAYVFVRSGTTWTQQAYLKASNTGKRDSFGWSVSVSGDTAVVGAYAEDSNATGVNGNQSDNSASYSGAAYVFVRNGTTWSQQAYLKASNTDRLDLFGLSVSVSGDTIVVGAQGEASNAKGVNGDQTFNGSRNAGAAYVFVRSGTNWSQEAYLKASNTRMRDLFGCSVSVSDDTAVIGARWEASNATGVNGDQGNNSKPKAGAGYMFVRSGTNWTQQAYLKGSNTNYGFEFGYSVAASGNTVVVGAPDTDFTGAAFVFERSGTIWSQQAYLKASNAGSSDNFGISVAVSGDKVAVGAPGEASRATGVNGDESDNSLFRAGAAYVFVRSGTSWGQQAYVKASNTDVSDGFGLSVSVSGNMVVAAAPGEDSNANGVNGDQSDNSATSAGAVYVFGPPPPKTYCSGKTTSGACVPFISFSGTPSTSSSPFLVRGNDHLESQPGLLIYSTRKGNLDFHGGKLCVKVPFRRMPMVKSTDGIPCVTCAGNCRMFELDFNHVIQSGQDPMLTQGQCVNAQWRQVDPGDPYGDALSDGLSFIVGL